MLYYLYRPYAAGAGKTARMGETVTMAWYDNAVFYHIYPLGLCGCAHENDGQPTPGAFAKLNAWAEHAYEDLGCTAIYIGPHG